MAEEEAQKKDGGKNELSAVNETDPNTLAQSHHMALTKRESTSLALQSAHITSLAQTQNVLKQELVKHDAALVPVVEAINKLEQNLDKKTKELQHKESKLSAAEKEAAAKNPDLKKRAEWAVEMVSDLIVRKNDEVFGVMADISDFLFGGDLRQKRIEEFREQAARAKNQIVDTSSIEKDVKAVQKAVTEFKEQHKQHSDEKTEIELKKTYEIFTQLILNEQATRASFALAHYAANSNTSLDAVLEKNGDLASPFADGRLTREALDAALEWAKKERGNMDLPPEQLAFKQFINRLVVPHIGSFEALASMVDDLNATGIETRQPLELLKQKPISLSGRKPTKTLTLGELNAQIEYLDRAKDAAAKAADYEKASELREQREALVKQRDQIPVKSREMAEREAEEMTHALPAIKIDAIIRSAKPIEIKVADAVGENEKNLQGFEGLFADVEKKIDDLLATASDKEAKRQELIELAKAGRAKNERIDDQIGQTQFDLGARKKLLPPDKPKALRLLGQGTKRAVDAAIFGAAGGTAAAPGIGTALGGAGGLVVGFLLGLGEGALDSLTGGDKGLTKQGEVAVRQELIDYLRSQKVDVEKHNKEIEGIAKQLTKLMGDKDYQAEVGSRLKAIKIRNAYIARSLLRSGVQNTSLLAESCEQNGVESLDAFVNSFEGELGVAVRRFCFGLANSNDMSLIIAESNALTGDQLKPHERVLKDFVENVMKPDIGGYLSKASKVDVISQSNLLPYGAPLEWTKGIVRDENDSKLSALVANEFGMAVVGVQDVKHVFDFYLHRHGDRQLYDAKLKDGQMTDQYPSKRINVYPPEEVERFVDMTKQSMSHGRKTLPEVSDMFLRVCAYEYFMPQAVRTAGADNIFSENPEAPVAYPMVNATVNKFIEEMSLGPIKKYRELVGERLDNVIAQTFIDYFATLGAMHADDPKIKLARKQLRDSANSEDYGPVFSSYMRKISNDSGGRFRLFMDIYRNNLEKQIEISTEEDRKMLEAHLASLPDPSKTILTPDIVKPGSHKARLLAAYEDHSLENTKRNPER